MSNESSKNTNTPRKTIVSFVDFCSYDSWKSSDENGKSFVGIKMENNKLPVICFPMGLRNTSISKPSEKDCKRDFHQLISVLNDRTLQAYLSEDDLKESKLDFPFHAFVKVLQYYLDFGYFAEPKIIYKKDTSGRINWPRTIKKINPQVAKNRSGQYQVVYLDLITRGNCYREDCLITLVHKYCVWKAANLIGPLYGVNIDDVENPKLQLNYDLFTGVIQEKISIP